jgi:hypothetical protein
MTLYLDVLGQAVSTQELEIWGLYEVAPRRFLSLFLRFNLRAGPKDVLRRQLYLVIL